MEPTRILKKGVIRFYYVFLQFYLLWDFSFSLRKQQAVLPPDWSCA